MPTEFLRHFKLYWPKFIRHHQQAKLQDDDISFIKKFLKLGVAFSVQDFSENYHIKPKLEHQSRSVAKLASTCMISCIPWLQLTHDCSYYSEVGATVYGMVLTACIDDFKNITDDQKAELHALHDREGLPHVLTESHIVITPDLTHDPAAVQHFNDKIITKYLKENIRGCVEHIRISDGAPTQFKLCVTCDANIYRPLLLTLTSWPHRADQALWISQQSATTGIKCDWVFRGTAHGKDLSDSECGAGECCCIEPLINIMLALAPCSEECSRQVPNGGRRIRDFQDQGTPPTLRVCQQTHAPALQAHIRQEGACHLPPPFLL